MSRQSSTSQQVLSLWEALEEEHVALGGTVSATCKERKGEYLRLRAVADEALRDDPAGLSKASADAVDARDTAEREYIKYLVDLLHDCHRSALCFSGGGIRSATYGLGVLH